MSLLAEGTRAAADQSCGGCIRMLLSSLFSLSSWLRGVSMSSAVMSGCCKGAGLVAGLATAYMLVSTGMLAFNKYWMSDDRFPFAAVLGLIHMVCSFGFNFILYLFRPDLYPSLDHASKVVDKDLVVKVLLPIACCFAAQLVLSNMAFMHSSVAFLQMMKQSNVVLVYCFSLAISLERFSWIRFAVLALIVGSTALTIHGELNFSSVGFVIQSCSMLCESMKLTLQSYSLSSSGRRLDPLTYVMLVAPIVLFILAFILVVLHCMPMGLEVPEALSFPPWHRVVEYRWLLCANGCLAFAMNVVHALFIKSSSAITFILTGVLMKDIVIVGVASIFMGEMLSSQQVVGFGLQLLGILAWSVIKMSPSFMAVATRQENGGDRVAGSDMVSIQMSPLFPERPRVHASTRTPRAMFGPGEAADYEELAPLSPKASKGRASEREFCRVTVAASPREPDSPRDSATDSPRDPEQPDFSRDAPQPVPEHRRSSGRDSRWDASAAATFEVSATSPEVQSPRHCAAGQRDAKGELRKGISSVSSESTMFIENTSQADLESLGSSDRGNHSRQSMADGSPAANSQPCQSKPRY